MTEYTEWERQWFAEKTSDPRTNDELIEALMADPYDEAANDLFTILQARRDPAMILKAVEMCGKPEPVERYIGAGILTQNGAGNHKIMLQECSEALLDRVMRDDDPDVLAVAASGLQDYSDERISSAVARLSDHPDSDVRFSVVMSLLTREDETAINTMIALSKDADTDVRNWATFGLAQQIDTDTSEITKALLVRTDDGVDKIRAEALIGLARRDDERVVDLLIREFDRIADDDGYWDAVIEAAIFSGDFRLHPYLVSLHEEYADDRYTKRAIATCRLPKPDEMSDEPDDSYTTCPVCWLRETFSEPNGFCPRCGWDNNSEQRDNPDEVSGWTNRSVNQERARWLKRVEKARLRASSGNE